MKYNLLPFIHLDESSSTTIYDANITMYDTYNLSSQKNITLSIVYGIAVSEVNYQEKDQL
jgi:predicted adenine nucleotide alpha hydrolase (AANH) superfamily ATPase